MRWKNKIFVSLPCREGAVYETATVLLCIFYGFFTGILRVFYGYSTGTTRRNTEEMRRTTEEIRKNTVAVSYLCRKNDVLFNVLEC